MKIKKVVSIILVIAVLLSNFVVPTVNVAAETGSMTIRYYNENNWENPYIYYYTDTDSPISWPGMAMDSDGDGWYSYEICGFDEVKVIFSDNGSNQIPGQNQTGYTVTGGKWFAGGTWYDDEPDGITVHYHNYNNWENVNIYYYSGERENTVWSGVPMSPDGDGWYTYKIYGYDETRVLFNNGRGTQIPGVMEEGFAVSDEMWYRNGTWTTERPEEITLYFYKPKGWSAPNVYYYLNENDTGSPWPGEAMKKVYGGWYTYTITKYSSARVLFSDGINQIPPKNQPGFDAAGIMWYKDGVICDMDSDTDKDGLPDCMEMLTGTNINNRDTDGDRLPDGYEVFTLETDPLKADTDNNGIDDSKEDDDNDGLTNLKEYQLGTDPKKSDTDGDGLSDGEEVNTYNTNPLEKDTDGDTLSDNDDIELGFSPLLQDTDGNGVADCDEPVEQILNNERFDDNLLTDNYAVPAELEVVAKGNINSNTSIYEYDGYLRGEEREYVGKPIEITGSGFETGKLTFSISEDYIIKSYDCPDGISTNGLLICYNDGKDTVPLETDYNPENRTISADISGPGMYFVFDFMQWTESLGIEPVETTQTGIRAFSSENNTSIAKVDIKGQVDIVFAIDTTGSMGTAIRNVQSNIIEFVNELDEAGIKPSFALVDFRDITCDGQHYTHIVKNGDSNWFTDAEKFKEKVSSLSVSGGGDGPETPVDALEMARSLDMRKTSQKFIILVTDADYKVNNNYGITSMNQMAGLLKDDNINVSVISNTSYREQYKILFETAGGIFADIYGNFKSELLSIADKIDKETNNGYWAALNGLLPKLIKLDEKPSATGTADTDKDSLLDREELADTRPTKIVDVNSYYCTLIKPFLNKIGYAYPYIEVYDYHSDPTMKDSDGDGLYDGEPRMAKGKKVAPKDPEPLSCNGPKGIWEGHVENLVTAVVPSKYDADSSGMELLGKLPDEVADFIVPLIVKLDSPMVDSKPVIRTIALFLKKFSNAEWQEAAGAYILNFIHDEYGMAYHSQPETWQRKFGYNKFYDDVFRVGSYMATSDAIKFESGGDTYALWFWKGDYWNLHSGAEIGMYKYSGIDESTDMELYDAVDFELPMELSLYYHSDYSIKNVFNWAPDVWQWWITGFNTSEEFENPGDRLMVSIGKIDFSKGARGNYKSVAGSKAFFRKLKEAVKNSPYDIIKKWFIFDEEDYTVWIVFDKEAE